ncbi:MAG: hypothetical protein AAGG08_18065 [Actinomycetota bacterium]
MTLADLVTNGDGTGHRIVETGGEPTTVRRPYLVRRRFDGWLLGGLAITAWALMAGLPALGVELPGFRGPVLWALLAATATHFAVSYHLAYGPGRDHIAAHRLALVIVPSLLLFGVLAVTIAVFFDVEAVSYRGPQAGLVAVYSLTTWHFVKQTYGVMRAAAALTRVTISDRMARALRYGLYPMWLADAATVWTSGYQANDYGFDASYSVLPSSTVEILELVSLGSAVVVVGALVAIGLRSRRLPPSVWTPYGSAILWIVFQPDHLSALLVFGAAHALQYLAFAHRAEVEWARHESHPQPVLRWCGVFGGALAAGMMATYWLPMWLGYADGRQLGVTLAALVFVVLNLHHYAVDAVIWRSRGAHTQRIIGH